MKADDKNKLMRIFLFVLYGNREEKYKFPDENSMGFIPCNGSEVKNMVSFL